MMRTVRYPGPGAAILFWTEVGAITSARNHLLPGSNLYPGGLANILSCAVCFYPWTVLTPLVFRLEKEFPRGNGRWPRNLAMLALTSVPLACSRPRSCWDSPSPCRSLCGHRAWSPPNTIACGVNGRSRPPTYATT